LQFDIAVVNAANLLLVSDIKNNKLRCENRF